MTALSVGTAALFPISGEWSNNLPLREFIAIYENGSPMDLTGLEFEFQLRCKRTDSSTRIFSTDDGFVLDEVENEAGNEIEVLRFDDADISGLCGEYIADFIMKDADGNYTHLAHGTVSVRNDPVAPSI